MKNRPKFPNGYNKKEKIFYHGSKGGLQGKIEPKSDEQCDFGKGFYVGETRTQVEDLICNDTENTLISYQLKTNFKGLKTFEFTDDKDWALFIARNRGMKKVLNNPKLMKYLSKFDTYDVIIGTIADDRFTSVLKDFFKDNITLKALKECLDMFDYGKQYCFMTQKACDTLEIIDSHILSAKEINQYRQIREDQFNNIDEKIEDVKAKYRRSKSKYFFEILEEIK